MCDETTEYYQSPATKEDIENLDDKLENLERHIMCIQISQQTLSSKGDKLVAWTQRAGRMAKEFLAHFPQISLPTDKE